MTLSLRIRNIETIKTELANARKGISKLGKIKKKHRNILHNLDNVLRRELDTSPYQTILTPGGLWIDYDPDLKKGKVKKYYDELVKEPFAKLYTKPNKDAMQQAMNEDFKVMFGDEHVATIEYTKFKEEDLEKEKKPSIFGQGKSRWKPTLSMEDAPKGSVIRAYYYGYETDGNFARQVWNAASFPKKAEHLYEKLERINKGRFNNYRILPYDDWGYRDDLIGEGLSIIILTWAQYLEYLNISRVDEKRFEALSKKHNYDDYTRDYFKRVESFYMNGLRYYFKGISMPQYRIFASAGDWLEAVEEFGEKLFRMDPVSKKQREGKGMVSYLQYIPLKEVKIYNRDDPEDVAYDGPIDKLN